MRDFPRYYILVDRVPFAVDMETWGKFFMRMENRRVAQTVIDAELGVSVSTVFLGLDHNFTGKGDPVLFETMAFGPAADSDGGNDMGSSRRYSTWARAEKGHAAVVAKMTALVKRVKAQSSTVIGVKADGQC